MKNDACVVNFKTYIPGSKNKHCRVYEHVSVSAPLAEERNMLRCEIGKSANLSA